ncbi:hypothetical protein [Candidatus Harpocratesius sp.]
MNIISDKLNRIEQIPKSIRSNKQSQNVQSKKELYLQIKNALDNKAKEEFIAKSYAFTRSILLKIGVLWN